MRKLFPGYYRPTDQEFSELWQQCVFTFDTSVLLNIQQYGTDTQERFFDILRQLSDRIWLPYQVVHEYHKNRTDALFGQIKVYKEIEKDIKLVLQRLERQVSLFIAIEDVKSALEKIVSDLQAKKTKPPRLIIKRLYITNTK